MLAAMNDVRPEERRDDVQRLLCGQFFMQPQNSQLALDIQAVSALGLDCRRSVSGEFAKRSTRSQLQYLGSSGAQLLHRIQDPAALVRDLFVARAGDFEAVLFGAAGRMNEVGVRIDEPRQRNAAAEVQDLCADRFRKRLHRSASSDRRNQAVAYQQCSISDDAEVG